MPVKRFIGTFLIATCIEPAPSALFSQTPSKDSQRDPVAAAGYQAIDDCNENNIPDNAEVGSGRFFSLPLSGLQGAYGGIIGNGHSAAFHFNDDFLVVRHAWLRLAGVADPYVPYSVDLAFYVRLDSTSWGEGQFSDLDEYELCMPLVPPAVNGTISLVILVGACCDHISIVESASLWLDAVPMPPPQTLQDFASLQNCFDVSSDDSACNASDMDWDGDIDLVDLGYFAQILSDP